MNDQFESFGVPVRRRPPPPQPTLKNASNTVNNITVSGGQVGSINTGNIGSFALTISQIKAGGQPELAASFNELLTAVLSAPDFTSAVKNEIIELLASLAEQTQAPAQAKRPALARTVLKRLTEIFSDASSVNRLWERLAELLSGMM